VTARDRYDEQARELMGVREHEDLDGPGLDEMRRISLALRAAHAAGRREGIEACVREVQDKHDACTERRGLAIADEDKRNAEWFRAKVSACEALHASFRSLLAADASEPERDAGEHRVGDEWERLGASAVTAHVERESRITIRREGGSDLTATARNLDRLGWRRVQRKGEP
jgi:hypothetical protein